MIGSKGVNSNQLGCIIPLLLSPEKVSLRISQNLIIACQISSYHLGLPGSSLMIGIKQMKRTSQMVKALILLKNRHSRAPERLKGQCWESLWFDFAQIEQSLEGT